ncbi:unnamed protein product [Cochlearia groenlandica]
MCRPNSSSFGAQTMKREVIEIDSDSDTDEAGSTMLALCGKVNTSRELINTSAETKNKTSKQVVCANEYGSSWMFDEEYKKYLALTSCSKNHQYFLEDKAKDSYEMRMYNFDNKTSDRSNDKRKTRARSPLVSNVPKKLKIENGKTDHKSISRDVYKKNKTQQKRGDARHGKKIALTKNTIEVKPICYVKNTQHKKEDIRRGRKSYVTKNKFKACKNEKEKSNAGKNEKSLKILRASKRLKTEKTIPVVKTKETKRKKEEIMRERKTPVKNTDLKACKKETEESSAKWQTIASKRLETEKNIEKLSSVDESYEYFLLYLTNAVTIAEPDQKVKPVKDLVSYCDPDIIAISNHPFTDEGKCLFTASKDEKVIDLDDATEPEIVWESSFSKRLIEILRKPYNKKEFIKRFHEASLKRPVTRYRQLRDGREIEYDVDNQFRDSYLQRYPEFNKKFRRVRYKKDPPRALNLLRGFSFYIENIVLDGAFQPWLHEKRVEKECKAIVCVK